MLKTLDRGTYCSRLSRDRVLQCHKVDIISIRKHIEL